ncbi:MAG: peptidase dimerization domain-containing protein [Chloroflexota bacterium]
MTAIDDLTVPMSPKTTHNVGLIEGGTSINTIAHHASIWLDLRSEEVGTLSELRNQVENLVEHQNRQQILHGTGVIFHDSGR